LANRSQSSDHETTVVSYLTDRIGRNLIIAAHQELTREWWNDVLPVLGGCISDLVLEEAEEGQKHPQDRLVYEPESKKTEANGLISKFPALNESVRASLAEKESEEHHPACA